MFTKLTIRNFKKIKEASIPLNKAVVFVGPNNSGKTSALQALILWETGLKAWIDKRGYDSKAKKRSGVTINRKEMIAVSVPSANLLWNDLHVREFTKETKKTKNILIEIIVDGITEGHEWSFGFEFDYANAESFYCRPLKIDTSSNEMILPPQDVIEKIHVAFLPPMSGLTSIEPRLQEGRINVLIGEGQTAQILRNLCYSLLQRDELIWNKLKTQMNTLFGVDLQKPIFNEIRGEVIMTYREQNGVELDLMSGGRGMQQTLLLLSYLYAKPNVTILLDEPDAHLEILRQRQIYRLINDVASEQNCQVISASHSEVVLNEAIQKDSVIAFLGKPHQLLQGKSSQLKKALVEIGFDNYYAAEEKGWVLYLEGSTDLEILKRFARKLGREDIYNAMDTAFVHFLGHNQPKGSREHFFGLLEAKNDLVGIAIFDRIDKPLQSSNNLVELMWSKRELENYFCFPEVLISWAKGSGDNDDLLLFGESSKREEAMRQTIQEFEQAFKITNDGQLPWNENVKASEEVIEKLLNNYFLKMELPKGSLSKGRYYEIADFLDVKKIDQEIIDALEKIWEVSQKAVPIQ
ncbi:MAG: AAA family ATPase [Epsilonproteobacteria bacterium]|nr:AAA family ATPase [Campylobacterota bacterium]